MGKIIGDALRPAELPEPQFKPINANDWAAYDSEGKLIGAVIEVDAFAYGCFLCRAEGKPRRLDQDAKADLVKHILIHHPEDPSRYDG
jgi:hypothetical protein